MNTRKITRPSAFFCALALAGCSSSPGGSAGGGGSAIDPGLSTDSRIVALNANGTLPDVGIDDRNSVSLTRITNLGGFAYQIGPVEGANEFLGVAGIAPDTQVGGAPTTATATYNGDYNLAYADRTRFERSVSGTIALDADFNSGTLTGQSGGLTVEGTITGQNIGGSASYRGVNADLTGQVGASRAVGAFAGHNDDAVLTGGFIAENAN